MPPVAQTAPEPTTAPAPEPASAMAPEPPTPAAPEAESAMEEPLPEADPVPPAEALPAPAYSEVDAPAESGPTMVLIVVAAVALGILVLWLRRRVRSASRSPAKTPGPWESVAASKAAERASGRRVALQSPPPGLRETGEAPAGAGSAGERVRPLEEREGKTPRSDAPKAGTTMTGMTRQR